MFLKMTSTILVVALFLTSLVWPYSSEYFSQDGKVRGKALSHEKVEVATDLVAIPAECSSGKLFRELQPEKRLYLLAEASLLFGLSVSKVIPGAAVQHAPVPLFFWQPSIVIALRRIVI